MESNVWPSGPLDAGRENGTPDQVGPAATLGAGAYAWDPLLKWCWTCLVGSYEVHCWLCGGAMVDKFEPVRLKEDDYRFREAERRVA